MSQRVLLLIACAAILGCRAPGGSRDGDARLISVAVVPFAVLPGSPPPPIDVADAIRTDLASSGRFAPTDVASMPSRPSDPAGIRFAEWRQLAVDYVIVGRIAMVHDGGHELEFQVVDARTETTMFGFQVPSAPDELPLTAREVAELVERRITG